MSSQSISADVYLMSRDFYCPHSQQGYLILESKEKMADIHLAAHCESAFLTKKLH